MVFQSCTTSCKRKKVQLICGMEMGYESDN